MCQVAHLTGIKRDAPDSELTEKEDTIKDDDEPWEPIHTPMPLRLGAFSLPTACGIWQHTGVVSDRCMF